MIQELLWDYLDPSGFSSFFFFFPGGGGSLSEVELKEEAGNCPCQHVFHLKAKGGDCEKPCTGMGWNYSGIICGILYPMSPLLRFDNQRLIFKEPHSHFIKCPLKSKGYRENKNALKKKSGMFMKCLEISYQSKKELGRREGLIGHHINQITPGFLFCGLSGSYAVIHGCP